jgi:iron(III) transport system substrate-binding protein
MVKKTFGLPRILAIALLGPMAGCFTTPQDEVVVYAALDKEFSAPILDDFQSATDIQVQAKYDVESTKTVNLVNAILQEQNRPRCDLFWNNEILNTLRLEKAGLLTPFEFPGSQDWPAAFRSPNRTWYGFAARARVLLVNTKQVNEQDWPTSVTDLADPRWKGKCGLAKPLFGTTATHAAVLFATWEDQRAETFFRAVRGNALVLSGNKQVALAVSSGQLAWGLTDTDDAHIEKMQGQPVAIVFPDQAAEQMGCLLIPNTIAIIKGSPHPEHAQNLAAYLYDAKNGVEERLAIGPSAQVPVNPEVKAEQGIIPKNLKTLDVDFEAAAGKWDTAAAFMRDEFATAD